LSDSRDVSPVRKQNPFGMGGNRWGGNGHGGRRTPPPLVSARNLLETGW
jgi:hypothetical protein